MRMAEMASSDLEDLALHINTKISDVKRTLQLRNAGEEPSFKSMLGEIKHEILLVKDLLNKMEMEVKDHKELNDLLKELQKSAESQAMEARHLIENIPRCLLKPTQSWYMKGRLTCDQVNAVVKGINKAVADKYKILHQPLRSLKAAARKLYNRFLEDETAESKDVNSFVSSMLKVNAARDLQAGQHAEGTEDSKCQSPASLLLKITSANENE
ncbi:spindle and kinetochore-associated protein 1-like [Athene cunicularia]|uniref:spindle and kinetochore-associated protein 1-like n=1 Tax=Athene cunicularia TaxID=194338 RepID=UPI000EF74F4B|nr:spindle and kinetochore-associated protein 1-like [Athene cunicularia]